MPEYGVFQNGVMVASAWSPDRMAALREAEHYAAAYSHDGPVQIREILEPATERDAGE